jgi:primosomal protein N' (replication factor Y)
MRLHQFGLIPVDLQGALRIKDVEELIKNRDTVGAKDAYARILDDMRSGRAQILLGTQMIAKGHDLPGVTFVGIVNADVGLHMPDFRANERTFQLLTQAAGRAGRGEIAGRVVIQTRQPNHPAIVAVSTNRFKAFARYEMDYRKELLYPPYGRMLRIIVSCPERTIASEAATYLRNLLQKTANDLMRLESTKSSTTVARPNQIVVLGPSPAPIERIKARWRYHLIIKGHSSSDMTKLGHAALSYKKSLPTSSKIRISIDIDPVDMM